MLCLHLIEDGCKPNLTCRVNRQIPLDIDELNSKVYKPDFMLYSLERMVPVHLLVVNTPRVVDNNFQMIR